jgi:hypothetical protein
MDIYERTSNIIRIVNNVNQLKSIEDDKKMTFQKYCSQYLNSGNHLKGELLIHASGGILYYDFNDDYTSCYLEFNKSIR